MAKHIVFMSSVTFRQKLKKRFDKLVYTHPSLNKFLRNINKQFSWLTSFQLRPYGVLTVKLRNGLTFKMETNETSSVTKLLFWYGADQYEYTSIFIKLIPKASVFFDIGSNTGYYSLLAAKANKKLHAYAFEPAVAPFTYLQNSVHINNLSQRVHPNQLALANSQGKITFYELQNEVEQHGKQNLGGTGSTQLTESLISSAKKIIVPCDTLDNFVQAKNITTLDIIKLDTEGNEPSVLKGAEKTIQQFKPIIICETLFQVNELELEIIFKSHGYEFYSFHEGHLHKTETLIRKQDNHVRDCFFVHPEKVALIKEFIQ